MCKENGILYIYQYVIFLKKGNTISSRNNSFYVNRLFRTYIFTFPATEANRFIDDLDQTIIEP